MTCWVGVVRLWLSSSFIPWTKRKTSNRVEKAARPASFFFRNTHDRSWGSARHTELAGSQLRSGTQHWTHEITVGVRHATLNSQDRGWGPARHTELAGSRLGSGTPHWTHRIATGGGRGRRRRRRSTGGGGEETDIKSNNPHLTGGEYNSLLTPSDLSARLPVRKSYATTSRGVFHSKPAQDSTMSDKNVFNKNHRGAQTHTHTNKSLAPSSSQWPF